MASRFFIPTSGEYAWTGSVWSATSTGAAGSAATPVDGDDVYILNGTARITSALDQSAIQLNSLNIGFSGEIGTSGASLQIGLDTSDKAHIYGSGTIRIAITETSSSTLIVYDDFVGILYLTGGAIATIWCGRRGQVVVSGGTYAGFTTCGCSLTFTGGTVGDIYALGGTHRSGVTLDVIDAYGQGTVVTMNAAAAAVTGTVTASNGAVYVHDSGGTIAEAIASTGGTLKTNGYYGGFTVTASLLYAGGKLFETPPVLITYTNATTKVALR